MKVYDEVNNLAQAIKESKEYIEYRDIRKEVFSDAELKSKVEEFEKKKKKKKIKERKKKKKKRGKNE